MDPAYLIDFIHEEDNDEERNLYSYKKLDGKWTLSSSGTARQLNIPPIIYINM